MCPSRILAECFSSVLKKYLSDYWVNWPLKRFSVTKCHIFMGRLLLICTISLLVISCQPGRPERKMLPDTPPPSSYLEEGPGDRLTQTVSSSTDVLCYQFDTIIIVQGKRQSLLALSMPDPAHDDDILKTIHAGQGLLPSLLQNLQQKYSGILIDLRSDAGQVPTKRADYLVQLDVPANSKDKETQFPVVFLSDRPGRINAFFQLLSTEPVVLRYSILTDQQNAAASGDCFSAEHPHF